MKNFAKKLSALLLSLALVLTMMPMMAVPVMAEGGTTVYTVCLNDTQKYEVTDTWLDQNAWGLQIFPSITKGSASYVIVDGTAIDDILSAALNAEAIDLPNAMISILPTEKNPISGADLVDATAITKLVDENGNDAAISDDNVFIADTGAPAVKPVLSFAVSKDKYSTYAEAKDVLDRLEDGTIEYDTVFNTGVYQPYVGGNLKKDLQLKKDGAALMTSVNFTGKYVITDGTGINVSIAAPTEPVKEEISMTVGDPALELETAYTWAEINLLYGEDYTIGWSIPEGEGSVVDYSLDSGDIVAVGAGKATVTAEIFKRGDDSFEPILINEWTITVAAKPAPAPAPAITDGQTANVGGGTYQVTSAAAKTAAFTKAANAKSATVPATVNVNGQTLEVTSIAPNAFAGTSVKTVTVKSKKLTKASVKGSLKGSKVKTVKVKVGKKKENKKFVKKYKKIFTKKNAGKKVKVK